MPTYSLDYAAENFEALIDKVTAGEHVIIVRDPESVVELRVVASPEEDERGRQDIS
jgi:antitoxin (DNA-binding transcriptional repressor) of toxin-antitoxin stability system